MVPTSQDDGGLEEGSVLPREIRDLAPRLGITNKGSSSVVRLQQHGTMRDKPAGRAMNFRAVQSIDLRRPEAEAKGRCAAPPAAWQPHVDRDRRIAHHLGVSDPQLRDRGAARAGHG